MYKPDYMNKIRNAKTRYEAADLIRAWSCQMLHIRPVGFSAEEMIVESRQNEYLARSLERDYSLDGDTPCPEDRHPWREWLKGEGFMS